MASQGTPPFQGPKPPMSQRRASAPGRDHVVFPAPEGPRGLHQDSHFWVAGEAGDSSCNVTFSIPY